MRVVWSNGILMTLLWLLWEWNGKSVKEKWVVQLGDYSILWMGNKVIHTRMGRMEMERSESIWYIQLEPTGLLTGLDMRGEGDRVIKDNFQVSIKSYLANSCGIYCLRWIQRRSRLVKETRIQSYWFPEVLRKPKLNKTFITCNFLNSSEKVIGNSIFLILHLGRGREGREGERDSCPIGRMVNKSCSVWKGLEKLKA